MAEYKIVSITPLVDIDERGRFVKIYRVRYTYKDIEDFIDIPESEYSEKAVREKIEQRIKEHEKLLSE